MYLPLTLGAANQKSSKSNGEKQALVVSGDLVSALDEIEKGK